MFDISAFLSLKPAVPGADPGPAQGLEGADFQAFGAILAGQVSEQANGTAPFPTLQPALPAELPLAGNRQAGGNILPDTLPILPDALPILPVSTPPSPEMLVAPSNVVPMPAKTAARGAAVVPGKALTDILANRMDGQAPEASPTAAAAPAPSPIQRRAAASGPFAIGKRAMEGKPALQTEAQDTDAAPQDGTALAAPAPAGPAPAIPTPTLASAAILLPEIVLPVVALGQQTTPPTAPAATQPAAMARTTPARTLQPAPQPAATGEIALAAVQAAVRAVPRPITPGPPAPGAAQPGDAPISPAILAMANVPAATVRPLHIVAEPDSANPLPLYAPADMPAATLLPAPAAAASSAAPTLPLHAITDAPAAAALSLRQLADMPVSGPLPLRIAADMPSAAPSPLPAVTETTAAEATPAPITVLPAQTAAIVALTANRFRVIATPDKPAEPAATDPIQPTMHHAAVIALKGETPAAPLSQPTTIAAEVQPSLPQANAAPAPVNSAPAPAQPGHDFAGLVDRLIEARDAAAPQSVHASVTHAEFGQVSLRFQQDAGGLTVAMSSPDPEFTPAVQGAVQAAMPTDRGSMTNDNPSQNQSQHHSGSGASLLPQGGSQERGADAQARAAQERNPRPAADPSQTERDEAEPRGRNGIFI